MADNCDKHPNDVDGNTPKELAEKFGKTSYFYQKEFFKELGENVYPAQAKDDREIRKREQLAGGLEQIAKELLGSFMASVNYVCRICENYMINPYKKTK